MTMLTTMMTQHTADPVRKLFPKPAWMARQSPYIMAAVIREQMILPVVLIGSVRRKRPAQLNTMAGGRKRVGDDARHAEAQGSR